MKLLAYIEIYVNGVAAMQIHNLNAWVDVARNEIMVKEQPGEHEQTAYIPKRLMSKRSNISLAACMMIWTAFGWT